MSQPTNIDPQQGFFGRSSSYGRPTSSGDPMNGVLPNPAYSGSTNGSSAPAHSFDTVHIQQLADFHQHQQTMLMQQQQGQQMSQMPKPVQPNQLRAANQQRLQMPQPQQAITQFTQTAHQPVSSHQVQLQSLPQLQQPQRSISQQQPQTRPNSVQPQQQMRVPQSLPQQQLGSHPALSSSSSMPPRQSSPPRSNNALRPSIPVTQTFQVPAQGLPTSSPNKAEPRSNDPSGSAKPWRPNTAGGWEKDNRTQPLDRRLNASPQAVYLAGAEPIPRRRSPVDRERERDVDMRTSSALADARRRRDEGMRGSMRNEISRLMYAAGDVPQPDSDSVDYMEDLTVEFLADLCRPVPLIRSNPSSSHQPVPLNASIIRHRLSCHRSLRKYLDRFDVMNYMSSELAAQRRVVNSTETHFDLIDTVGKEYLGLNESGADGDGPVKKRRGRPPNPDKEHKERKKPGPVKGFKRVADPNSSKMRRPYKRRDKAGSVVSAAPNGAQA